MNIALFTDSFLPTKSGIVTVVLQLKKALTELGHHVVIVTVNTHDDTDTVEDEENILKIKAVSSGPFGVPDQFIAFPQKKKVIAFLKKHNIELIHSHTEFFVAHAAKISGKILHIPVIATTHTLWEDFYKYYLFAGKLIPVKIIRKIVKRLFKKFYALINVSQKAHDYFKQPFMLPSTPSAIIPNAIDSETFFNCDVSEKEIQALKKQWGIKKNDIVLLFLGRIVYEKRVEELLEICMRVIEKDARIKTLFVGAGPAIQTLERRARRLSDRIIFTGYVPWGQVHVYYRLGDIFVTASLSEMHSMTVLEALVSGLPIVARRDESFYDTIFHGQNGYFADIDEEMDDYILSLVADEKTRNAFKQKSLEISKGFSVEMFVQRTLAFYKKIMEAYPDKVTDAELREAVEGVGR